MFSLKPMKSKPFFSDGLRFECTECGECCTGDPGTIYINDREVTALAKFLGRSEEDLIEHDMKPMGDGHTILERENGDCYYLKDGRCSVHPVRPTQCRTYPFWVENLRSEKAWKSTCKECPGIGQGKLWSEEEILEQVHRDMER